MMNIRNITITVCSILLLCSCEKEAGYDVSDDAMTYSLSVSVDGYDATTKSVGEDSDRAVNNLKLLVFDRTGKKILYRSTDTDSFEDIEVPGKQKLTIYAVANSPDDFADVGDLGEFLSMRSEANTNTSGNLVMVGHVDTLLTGNASLVIPVKRIAAKVVIENFEYKVASCSNAGYHSLIEIYLTNISSDCPYSLETTTPTRCVSGKEIRPMGVSYQSINDDDGFYYSNIPHVLYAYPTNHNYTGKNPGLVFRFFGSWSEEIEPDVHYTHACYHNIGFQIPDLEANTLYKITKVSMIGKRYGSTGWDGQPYEIKAECGMETYDMLTGKLIGKQTMEAEVYEVCDEIR